MRAILTIKQRAAGIVHVKDVDLSNLGLSIHQVMMLVYEIIRIGQDVESLFNADGTPHSTRVPGRPRSSLRA